MAVGVTYVSFLSQHPPEVVLGAFMGSVIFLLGTTNKPKWQWVLLFTVALITGLIGANTVAEVLKAALGLIRLEVTNPLGLGAMLASSCVVNVVMWLRDNPAVLLRRYFGMGKKEDV